MNSPPNEKAPGRQSEGALSENLTERSIATSSVKSTFPRCAQCARVLHPLSPVERAERRPLRSLRLRKPKTAQQIIRKRISEVYVFAALQRLEHRGLIQKVGALPPIGNTPWHQPHSLWVLVEDDA